MHLKYNNFLEDLILEKIINESIVYYSPNMRKILKKIDNDISNSLLNIEGSDVKPDVTFIDNDDSDVEYISFTSMRNVIKELEKYPRYLHISSLKDSPAPIFVIDQIYSHSELKNLFKTSRNKLRIGRLINKIFPGKYSSKEIEEFVNKFKSKMSKGDFKIVEGDEIAHWYKESNYEEVKGQLGNSCMRAKGSNIFKIYTENPEVCRMLILVRDEKLLGRALLWKLTYARAHDKKLPEELYFLDRQYTIDESDVERFRNYADENGWAFKTNNNHHSFTNITYLGESFNATLRVDLPKSNFYEYPYMDTFRRLDTEKGALFNDDDTDSNDGHYILADTDGGYTEIESGIWSQYENDRIPEDYAVWSDWADSYLDSRNSIEITNSGRRFNGWYPDGCEDIVWDGWNDEHIHINISVYSETYGYYIPLDDSIQVISDHETDGSPIIDEDDYYHGDDTDLISMHEYQKTIWFRRISDVHNEWRNYGAIVESLCTKNYKNQWVLKYYTVTAYNSNYDGKYLTKIDAKLLGKTLNENDSIKVDKFEYYYDIKDILKDISDLTKSEIQKFKQQIKDKGQLRLKFKDDEMYINLLKGELTVLESKIDEIESNLFIEPEYWK